MDKFIFSLTTIPNKFDKLYLTIDSLINQTIKPEKIIVNIPRKYSLRFKTSIDNSKIIEFNKKYENKNVIINLLDNDYGPGTKLLGIFNNNLINLNDKNTYIILVDDDNIYKPNMIEYFINYKKVNTNCEVASYHLYPLMGIRIGQGADGFFIKSTELNKFIKYYNIIKNFDYINYHDDFYISYFFHLKKTKIYYIRFNNGLESVWDSHNNINALSSLSGKYERYNLQKNVYFILLDLSNKNKFDFL